MTNKAQTEDPALQELKVEFEARKGKIESSRMYEFLKSTVNANAGASMILKRGADVANVGLYGGFIAGSVTGSGVLGGVSMLGLLVASPALSLASAALAAYALVTRVGSLRSVTRAQQDDTPEKKTLRAQFQKAATGFVTQLAFSGAAMVAAHGVLLSSLQSAFSGVGGSDLGFPLAAGLTAAGTWLGWRAHKDAEKMSVYRTAINRPL